MARIGVCGWEMNYAGAIGNLGIIADAYADGTGCSIESSIVRSGTYSGKIQLTSGVAGYFGISGLGSASLSSGPFFRTYFRFASFPASERVIVGNPTGPTLRINSSGIISYYSVSTLIGSASTALQTDTWHRIEWRIGTATNQPILLIDGDTQITATIATGALSVTMGANDTVAATYTAYVDDFAADDSVFPGEGKVALLVPISDSVRDSLWTGGAGGTTNLYDAVNNLPPTGTASETDLTQIEHSGGGFGSTDDYEANMTTYTNAGVQSSDLVSYILPFIIHGEDVNTGTKLLAVEVLSNPAIAISSNITAGSNIGALGTFPTNWDIARGNVSYGPTVTKGTSPVMRVRRPETASRVASVCFMGMYIEYFSPIVMPDSLYNRPYGVAGERQMRQLLVT